MLPRLEGQAQAAGQLQPVGAQRNPVTLLEAVANVVCGREEHHQPIYSLVQLQKMMIIFHKKSGQRDEDYNEAFECLWDTFVTQEGCMWRHPGLIGGQAQEIAKENDRKEPNDAGIPAAEV